MPYDATDTARAAEKLGRDIDVMDANELAAWDNAVLAAIPALLSRHWEGEGSQYAPFRLCDAEVMAAFGESAAQIADATLAERRRRTARLVAGRVGEISEPRVTEHERRVIVAACEAVWHNEVTPRLIGAVKAMAGVHPEYQRAYHGGELAEKPAPSALTAEQRAVIDAAREVRKDYLESAIYTECHATFVRAVDALNAAEGRPQE